MPAVRETIIDITDPEMRGLLREFGSPVKARPWTVGRGDSGPRRFRFVEPINSTRRAFKDANTTGYAIKVAVGNLDAAPTSGTYTITRNSNASAAINYNDSAATVQTRLNAITGFPGTGCTVTKFGDNSYEIRFNANGAQAFPLVAGTNLLEPESNIVLTTLQPGDASTPTIVWLRLLQAPIALQDTFTAYPTGTASVQTIVEGSATSKELIRISIDEPPYDGSLTIAFGTVEKFTITVTQSNAADALDDLGFIMFDEDGLSVGVYFDGTPDASITATDRQINVNTLVTGDSKATVATKLATAIAADGSFTATASGNAVKVTLENAGEVATPVDVDSTFTFNVTQSGESVVNSVPVDASARDFAAAINNVCNVTKTGEFQWDLKFRDFGDQPTVAVDASALFPSGYEGEINFLTRQCLRAFQATTDAFISPYLEVQLTPPGEGSFTVLHIPITIVRDIIADEMEGSATLLSYYTAAEINAQITAIIDGTTHFDITSSFEIDTPSYAHGMFRVENGVVTIGDVSTDVNGNQLVFSDTDGTLVILLTQTASITAPNGITISAAGGFTLDAAAGLTLNSTQPVKGFISATTTWDPASLSTNSSEVKSGISMPGVNMGDVVTAALSTINSANWSVQATVTATNTVAVKITNLTGGTVDLSSGTLRINCLKF
jgi:hypothetical protein